MQAHQKRVVEEKHALDIKLDALNEFIDNSNMFPNLPEEERNRLYHQAYVMRAYSNILGERIVAFE